MQFENKRVKTFVILSSLMSLIQGAFYVMYGVYNGFTLSVWLMIIGDVSFIPIVFLFRRKGYSFYLLAYSIIILYCTAFNTTELLNNFSALLCVFLGILIYPKYKKVFMAVYVVAVAVMFALNDEPIYYLIIHTARTVWIFVNYDFVLYEQYNRKPFILYDEEKQILEQLTKNKLQKEIDLNGYSESTIRRRLTRAKKRNGIKTTEELKELYLKTYKAE